MKSKKIPAAVIIMICLCALGGMALAAQDMFTLKAPDGIPISEFRGYETWQVVAPSRPDDGIKVILANDVMIKAYKEGIPGNGKPFPDGSMIVKIEWFQKKNPESPYSVDVPDKLKRVGFIEKDSKRFPETNGWGYAQLNYDAASDTFKLDPAASSAGKDVCHPCHMAVKTKDYIFTGYPRR